MYKMKLTCKSIEYNPGKTEVMAECAFCLEKAQTLAQEQRMVNGGGQLNVSTMPRAAGELCKVACCAPENR